MIIESIELHDYRNYENLKISLDKNVNIFYGKNAQGKTNLLEAAYMSGTTKSHRGNKDKEIIRIGCEEAHIKTCIAKENQKYQIDFHLKNNKKKGIAINRVPVKKASDIFGILQVILFSPEDLNIIKNGPADRRRFLDIELCQIDKIYLYHLSKYQKALSQRNKILKDIQFQPSLRDILEVWTQQVVSYGKKIIKRREEFLIELGEVVKANYLKITGGKEELTIVYEPNTTIEHYEENIKKASTKDERYAQTSVGPHRDDFTCFIKDMDARVYGSQGQQRSCALALKLSEIEIMEKITGEKPVLLLDDVLSELDNDRQNALLKSLQDTQTLMTCTGMEDIIKSNLKIGKLFSVNQAKIETINA